MDFHPLHLSRNLARLALANERFDRALAQGARLFDPFGGSHFPGKAAFDQAQALPEADPMRRSLLRWVQRLGDERVQLPFRVAEQQLRVAAVHVVREPAEAKLSLATMRERALSSPAEERPLWWKNIEMAEQQLADHRLQLWLRRFEVEALLAPGQWAALWSPLADDEGPCDVDELQELARCLIAETNDAAEHAWGAGWYALVEAALARPASEGWPARLAPDVMRQLLGGMELTGRMRLEPGALPQRLAPASFVRAAREVGVAWYRAQAPTDLPFVVARDADGLMAHRHGELFALWLQTAPFLRRTLSLGRPAALTQQRHLAVARLAWLRLGATRLLVWAAIRRGRESFADEFNALSRQLLATPLPRTSALARFAVRIDEPARFCAQLAAAADERRLVDEHDEDWLFNPRAQEQLQDEARLPETTTVARESCQRGLVLALDELKSRL